MNVNFTHIFSNYCCRVATLRIDVVGNRRKVVYSLHPLSVVASSVCIHRQNMSQHVSLNAHSALTEGCVLFHIQMAYLSICVCLWFTAVFGCIRES